MIRSLTAVCWTIALSFWSVSAEAGVLARFQMNGNLGTIDVELFEKDKPVTVSNFVAYVKAGLWHDNVMHRWVAGALLQGGMYNVSHDPTLLTSWNIDPTAITPFPSIPFEKDVGKFYSNLYGTIAMARVGTDTNSAGASWFFNVADNTYLDTQAGGYTVFGRVLRGTNTLNRFVPNSGVTNIFNIFNTEVPVYTANNSDYFLLNTDITVLTAQIRPLRTGMQISWNSVEGKTNIVEFTRTLPAAWETLQSVIGTGAQMQVTDPAVGETLRQYRIRIDYSN